MLPARCYRLLEPLATHRISLTRIESRPSRRRKWDYVFFIDIEGHAEDAPSPRRSRRCKKRASLFRVLGLLSAGGAVSAPAAGALPGRPRRQQVAGDTHRAGRQVDFAPLR